MTDGRRTMATQARMAAQALDVAYMRLDRLRVDNRLEAERDAIDHHLRVHAVAMLRLLSRLYGSVSMDDEPALLSAYTAKLDPDLDPHG